MSDIRVIAGDCLPALRSLPDASIDAVVTDPPYGLADHRPAELVTALTAWVNGDRERVPDGRGFMGKSWDAFVPPPAVWDECLRVLKPGGHLVAFAGSRTYDLMGLSIRLAGFEIRDGLQWLYGSGFPKGQDVGKAIDATVLHGGANSRRIKAANASRPGEARTRTSTMNNGVMGEQRDAIKETRDQPATEDGARWDGWNTSLKPAHEPIVLARKPVSGTVARNVLEHGTGAMNIGACRVTMSDADREAARVPMGEWTSSGTTGATAQREARTFEPAAAGRWPTNVLLDEYAAAELDAQSGVLKSGDVAGSRRHTVGGNGVTHGTMGGVVGTSYADSGGASRFFPVIETGFRYQAKAPRSERPKVDGVAHPTVKPLALMAWLVRLLCPPGGTVLDPFAGSGTTGQAARDEGMAAVLVEREPTYWPLIGARLELDPTGFEQIEQEENEGGDAGVGARNAGDEAGIRLPRDGGPVGDEVPDPVGDGHVGGTGAQCAGEPDAAAGGAGPMIGTGDVVGKLERELEAARREIAHLRLEKGDLEEERDRALARLETAKASAWVAVPVPWRLVHAGDVIVGKTGHLLKVVGVETGGPWKLHIHGHRPDVWPIQTDDPDREVPVLRRPTADALDILTRQLGAQAVK